MSAQNSAWTTRAYWAIKSCADNLRLVLPRPTEDAPRHPEPRRNDVCDRTLRNLLYCEKPSLVYLLIAANLPQFGSGIKQRRFSGLEVPGWL